MTPVEIARQALHRLTETGLPPTPENYEAHYRSIAGLAAREVAAQQHDPDPALLETVRSLLGAIGRANDGLHADLTRFGTESSTLLASAAGQTGAGPGAEIFEAMAASANWLLDQVEATRCELASTREQLARVQGELERARDLVQSDPLTGLPNRRGLELALSRELARAARQGTPLCLAVLDIDHFKRINDEYGHAVGDQALRHLAVVLKPAVRDTDTLARIGGEEFVLVLPDTCLPDGEFMLNRLLRTLERAPLAAGGGQIAVRFSAGLALWAATESGEQLVGRADRAMYAAKRAGRGCVAVAE